MLLSVSRSADKFAPLAGLRSLLVPDPVAVGGGVVTRTIPASPPPRGEADPEESVDEEDEGCWVSYGRRDPGRRRLPPPIPSLAGRSGLRRARTEDRRLVISKVRVMRPDYYVRARHVRGGRLLMRLVEREDDCPRDPLRAPGCAREGGADRADEAAAVQGDVIDDEQAAAAPATMPAFGCFEDVVKYQYAIGSSPLHRVPLLRMVH
ncbi:uncharacterized protein LOC119320316 [Triticum dicoccoides]|uniref:uncharacterized protein LOC119320316 n=1 Tax=Triticum dicoccoides TaxID=85692 RepID=UPI00162D890D|nr:uncharacterized protein LOC119320316 [Triticum dicoccoides]